LLTFSLREEELETWIRGFYYLPVVSIFSLREEELETWIRGFYFLRGNNVIIRLMIFIFRNCI
jgi:hypothetical protein